MSTEETVESSETAEATFVQVVGKSGRVMTLPPKIASGMLRNDNVRKATAEDIKSQPKPGSNRDKPRQSRQSASK